MPAAPVGGAREDNILYRSRSAVFSHSSAIFSPPVQEFERGFLTKLPFAKSEFGVAEKNSSSSSPQREPLARFFNRVVGHH